MFKYMLGLFLQREQLEIPIFFFFKYKTHGTLFY